MFIKHNIVYIEILLLYTDKTCLYLQSCYVYET